MIKKINQVIINVLKEDRSIESSITRESYLLYPEQGKVLKNIKTNLIYDSVVSVQTKAEIKDYIEINK